MNSDDDFPTLPTLRLKLTLAYVPPSRANIAGHVHWTVLHREKKKALAALSSALHATERDFSIGITCREVVKRCATALDTHILSSTIRRRISTPRSSKSK